MRIAVVQMDVELGEIQKNLEKILQKLAESRQQGAELTIFPECALTGYCCASAEEALSFSQTIPGPATTAIQTALKRLGGAVVFGLIEQDQTQYQTKHQTQFYNSAVFLTADEILQTYRKIHLPYLGVDCFAAAGAEPFQVIDFQGVKFGLSICYDSAFPEAMRTLALLGADVILLPTNFPEGAEAVVEYVLRTRAQENRVYFAAANRIGLERGYQFIGRSQINAPDGTHTALADENEAILICDIDVQQSRNKQVGRSLTKIAIDRFADRRPEMYELLTAPHSLTKPGRD